ncbi:MAG TPA: M20/M25/M40 family metallo-hydrolase [Pyrinomonadaceae bacterium]
MRRFISLSIVLVFALAPVARAQERVDHQVIARIKTEAFQNSKVMETLFYMTDVHGPRLTGSPQLKAASEWARGRLAGWGLADARLEPWGTFGRGWSIKRYSVEMTAPQYMNVTAMPKAFTPGTNGPVSGTPVIVEIRTKPDLDKYRGKLRGKIVMNGRPTNNNVRFEPYAKRMTDDELKKSAETMNPGEPKSFLDEDKQWQESLKWQDEVNKFYHDEQIAVLLQPSPQSSGVINITAQSYTPNDPMQTFPAVVLAREHYGRIMRLVEKNIPVTLSVNVETQFHTEDQTGYNVLADLPGTDPRLKDELVMLGGHYDSWHAATGATDNAAGCAVMLEAMRILKTLGVRPRRTIRVALWTGEEQDYYGSISYVKKHFGDPQTLKLLPGHEKLSAYFNLDNGAGKIRGVNLQGNEAVRPIFDAYLQPFHYLGATTLTTANTGGTDHMAFEALGLPGFQFIQDPLEYNTRTHHTNLDFYEAVVEDDLKQAAAVIASFVYHTAMRDERLPREALPKLPPPDTKASGQ